MRAYDNIIDKLDRFTKKYYTKMLIKGLLLFMALGLMVLVLTLGIEYFLWLNSVGRMILLFCIIVAGLFLLYRFIFTPLFYLFKVRRGISNKDASLLIGKHFPNVADRLYNLLELADDKNQSELLLASIEQRSEELRPIPFTRAVDLKDNLRFIKYLVLPIMLIAVIWISGNLGSFFSSYERVVNYDMAYEPPAPFRFELLTNSLSVLENKSYTIVLGTSGNERPDAVNIVINENEILLQKEGSKFKYTFSAPLKDTDFYFVSGKVRSKTYHLNVLKAPAIQNFQLSLDYPKYLNKTPEVLKSTGNAILPEGTKVTWEVIGKNTEIVQLIDKDTVWNFYRADNKFSFERQIYNNLEYQISTSNGNVKDYEKLDYKFMVKKDAFPVIKVDQVLDSLNPNVSYFAGEASDDYKVSTIQLICYPDNELQEKQIIDIGRPNANFERFYYTFPSGLQLENGIDYSFYFVATDNDGIHGGKSIKSGIFNSKLLNGNELANKELKTQQTIIGNMDRNLKKFKEQKDVLEELKKDQKEKDQLNFNDQSEIKDFLQKQLEQENLMEKFSKQLQDNLSKSNRNDEMNKLLQERLERQEIEARKNEKLLEELNRIADKIDKEELSKRLEELGKNQQNSERNLEQLLELTKRYYVTEKATQLASDLEKLAKEQEGLSEQDIEKDISNKLQELKNEEFDKIAKELDELQKDNEDLKKPIELNIDKLKEESIRSDQEDALKEINEHQEEGQPSGSESRANMEKKTKQKQKSAAQKMKEMAEELSESSAGASGGSTITEDAEMLRQILDNLITFSFKQENLFDALEKSDLEVSQFSNTVKQQKDLRDLFEHVDDSLFALSLRRAELSEFVNEQITEVYYNIDKSLENIAENQIFQGVSNQKYVLNSSNSLADFLVTILENMQQSMQAGSSNGSSPGGFQLPDIIKGQGEIKEKMNGMGQSEGGDPKEGDGSGQEGESGKEGQGKEGENGLSPGAQGQGDSGKSGKKSGAGEGGNGQEGSNGQGQPSESELKELYEIYKEQQMLRNKLEQQLQDMINSDDRKLGEKLIRQMEDFENDLLENGVTQRTLNKVNNIEYELLKLENASLKKGKKSERESDTNRSSFQNPILTKPEMLENYRNEVEILNRQTLPLRQNYRNRVKQYFRGDD